MPEESKQQRAAKALEAFNRECGIELPEDLLLRIAEDPDLQDD